MKANKAWLSSLLTFHSIIFCGITKLDGPFSSGLVEGVQGGRKVFSCSFPTSLPHYLVFTNVISKNYSMHKY